MTLRQVALAALLALAVALPAAAEEPAPEFGTDRESAAKAAAAGTRARALEAENEALKTENAELRSGRDSALRLAETLEKEVAAQARLRRLAEEERDAYRDKAERVAAEKRRAGVWPLVKERAAEGALAGTIAGSAVPGVGNLVGAVGGGVLGAIAGAIEGWVSGP